MDIKRSGIKERKRRRRLYVGSAIAGVIGLVVLGLFSLDPPAPSVSRSQVWIDHVQEGEMIRQVRGTGVLVPREVRWIAAQSPGRIERVLVKPGARVAADEVLIEMTNPDLHQAEEEAEWALSAGRAELASARVEMENEVLDREANLASVEAQYESARLQSEAETDLAKEGIVPKIQAQQTTLDAQQLKTRLNIERQRYEKYLLVVKARIDAEQARIQQLENTLARRREQVANLEVRAGIDGVLQELVVEEGQQLVIGTSVGRVARPGDLMAELRVPEINARYVQLDQNVAVDTRNGMVDGRVIRIDPAVRNGTVQVDVDLVGNLPAGARPDLTVDGIIEIERLSDVVFVARPAYVQGDSVAQLFRVDDSGNATRVQVRLGRTSVNQIEVLDGLSPGDQVIVSDISAWDRHDRLSID
jgi:HlyD family secretion protein